MGPKHERMTFSVLFFFFFFFITKPVQTFDFCTSDHTGMVGRAVFFKEFCGSTSSFLS